MIAPEVYFAHSNDGFFKFGLYTSKEMGITIERFPQIAHSRKRITFNPVPGRIGDLATVDPGLDNVTISYKVWIVPGAHETLAKRIATINAWLNQIGLYNTPQFDTGEALLFDNYFVERSEQLVGGGNKVDFPFLRKAHFVGPLIVENTYNEIGATTITFSCSPRLYMPNAFESRGIGEPSTGLDWSPYYKIENQTHYDAFPLIVVNQPGPATLAYRFNSDSPNAYYFTVTVPEDGPVYIDCENETVYAMLPDAEGNVKARAVSWQNTDPYHAFPFIPATSSLYIYLDDSSAGDNPDQRALLIPQFYEL